MVDALVVRARAPGPAWWKVSDGGSVVWILGIPAALPKGTSWNDRLLKARLDGAHELMLATETRVSLFKALGFFLKRRKDLRSKGPLESSLPPELARRFAAAAIAAALAQPGETVAVVELRALLAQDGVLDQLRRRGLKVEAPAADSGV